MSFVAEIVAHRKRGDEALLTVLYRSLAHTNSNGLKVDNLI
jgi:hypothetical protein